MSSLAATLLAWLELYTYPVAALTVLIGALGVPLPTTIVVLGAGAITADGDPNPMGLFGIVLVAAVSGDMASYGIARWAGHVAVRRFGTRIGYATSILWWSFAAGLHVLARSTMGFGFWRAMLGLGEAGNFPAAIKAVAEWFPKKDRAFATGVFNAGSNVASMIGPPAFVALNAIYGWRVMPNGRVFFHGDT